MTKPKTDNTSMGNPPTGTYFKEDKQGWEVKLGKLFEDRGFYSLYYLKEYGWIYDFIRDLLSLQREEVRREVVEETLRGYVANEQLIESRRNDCSKGTIMWSKFAAEILNKYWFNKALSSDGEKKGTK